MTKGKFECYLSKELLTGNIDIEEKIKNVLPKENEKFYIISNEKEELVFLPDGKDLIITININGRAEVAPTNEYKDGK